MAFHTQVTAENSDFSNASLPQEAVATSLPLKGKGLSFKRPRGWNLFGWLALVQHRFFVTKVTVACFFLLLVSQLIVASSTLWLSFLSIEIEAGRSYVLFLVLYLTSLVLTYLPESFAVVTCNKWKLNAFAQFIRRFVDSRKNDTISWNDKTIKEGTISILNGESQATLNAIMDHVYNCLYYIFNVVFNIVAIAVWIEPKYALAYGLSLVMIFILMKIHTKKQGDLAQKAQTARIQFGQSLLSVWDNVLLGNKYSFNLWSKQADSRLEKANRLNHSSILYNQWLAFTISLLIFAPSFVVSIMAIVEHHHEPMALTALMLTLPRLFQALSYTQLVFSYTSQWSIHKAKLETIENILNRSVLKEEALVNRINWQKLSFSPPLPVPLKYELSNKNLLEPLETAVENLYPAGRYTLRGANGSGKSTLMMCIKNQVKEHGFYLPTKHNLAFLSSEASASTGEMLKHQLLEIQRNVDVRVILLDEWDANLDKANIDELTMLINSLSKDRCIIEVKHRV